MADEALWTLDQLVELVGGALSTDYGGAASGRVRDMPDRRTVRWYTSIGLVDRPSVMRGRTALYGARQLLQLVAVKRRQAAGRSLAQIQQELTGTTGARLREIAQVPAAMLTTQAGAGPQPPLRQRFWSQPAPTATAREPSDTDTPVTAPARHQAAGRAETTSAAVPGDAQSVPAVLHGVQLAEGLTLLLPADAPAPTGADLAAVRAAAQPLVDTLVQRGLISIPLLGGAQ